MPTKDLRIDSYIADAQPFARPILKRLRRVIHEACPSVEETMKWSFPHFQYKGMLCSMAAFKEHCAFGFWNQSILDEDEQSNEAMGQFGRLTSVDDLPSDKVLASLVKKAAALNDAGIKPKREVKPRKPLAKPPVYLVDALKKNQKARSSFDNFSPTQQREYIEWLTEAKTDDTRTRRLATAIEWMSEGKIRNWKYVTK
jgi:hypothetical protein